ncbi:MAG: hypothetical protein HZB25_06185 [Candidatus Eisenbacteria bacterium]|nr:hypothetical protein [Candidatus Eisenbacteria bacterium]
MRATFRACATTLLLIFCSFLAVSDAAAVNLVPNPGFESLTSCPTGFGQLNLAAPWDMPNTGTSDAFNTCVTGWPPFPTPCVPVSPFGYQVPHGGNGYAGIIVRSSAADYREYLEVPLSSPLVNGQTYAVKFYVNLGDTCSIAIDRLGAYFSVGPVGPLGNYAPLAYTPQVETPVNVFYSDTLNWVLVSGTFVAAGGETHMIVGNFHDDATTNTQATGNTWPGGAYYMVDDFSVEVQLPTVQACCTPDGLCSMQYPGECTLMGGYPGGAGTNCTSNPCGVTPVGKGSWGKLKRLYR